MSYPSLSQGEEDITERGGEEGGNKYKDGSRRKEGISDDEEIVWGLVGWTILHAGNGNNKKYAGLEKSGQQPLIFKEKELGMIKKDRGVNEIIQEASCQLGLYSPRLIFS